MMGPVHNSAVYVLGHDQHAPAIPPPSPPSPITPGDGSELCIPIEELSLDKDVVIPGPASPSPPESPATPTTADFDHESTSSEVFDDRLANAVHVLNTEATSLAFLTHLYSTDPAARSAFNSAVDVIVSRQRTTSRGKLVIIGVGKSGHIARKLVATFNSLSVHASFMHPTEALHGDLGHIGIDDTLMLITFSGKTPELNLLMPHLDARLPLIVLTGKTSEVPVVMERKKQALSQTVLLPAPIHESETVSFGVSAPTTSTTMALAVGDALALTCAGELNPKVGGVAATFGQNHPGGAIGAAYQRPQTVRDVMVPYANITCVSGIHAQIGGDILKAAYMCKTGWLRVGDDAVVSPSRIRRLTSAELALCVTQMPWLTVARAGFISLGARTHLKAAGEWLRANMEKSRRGLVEEENICTPESIIAVLDEGEIVGVMEASAILDITACAMK
ncbi:putative arabinose 5-phosphate isomerase [Cytospora mali]|uniref:Arabinose 5-phosphate isomerase n=1 Tax=Cytospora mali TaxID=578113 RepID=A0A194VAU5_CYTMA|nr:putative arabinose 5-phosphate isomerase [Valsa mali var. pyri (nom. inval.)]